MDHCGHHAQQAVVQAGEPCPLGFNLGPLATTSLKQAPVAQNADVESGDATNW